MLEHYSHARPESTRRAVKALDALTHKFPHNFSSLQNPKFAGD
jgi:hypothetical protein